MKTCPKCGGYYGPDVPCDSDDKCICKPQPEPQTSAPPEIRSSEWVDELKAALRHAKSARDGIERRDGNKTHTYGLNGAIVFLAQSLETERSRSSTVAHVRPHEL